MSNVAGLVQYTKQVNERASERSIAIHTRITRRMRAVDVETFALAADVQAQRGGK